MLPVESSEVFQHGKRTVVDDGRELQLKAEGFFPVPQERAGVGYGLEIFVRLL